LGWIFFEWCTAETHEDVAMEYEVGYKKPPKEFQFKKGQPGNRGGAPKKRRVDDNSSIELMKIIGEALDQKVDVQERGRSKKVTLRQLLFSKLAHQALSSGDAKALDNLLKWAEKADRARFEGRAGEPLRIIIEGGLPDNEPPPPAY
jgi:hypothetical protein